MALGHLALRGLGSPSFPSSLSYLSLRGLETGGPPEQVNPQLVLRGLGNGVFAAIPGVFTLRGLQTGFIAPEVTPAEETDEAVPIREGQIIPITAAVETDTAGTIVPEKTPQFLPSTEINIAVSLEEVNDSIWPDEAPFWQRFEKDAWPVRDQTIPITAAEEVGTALTITPVKSRDVIPAIEADSALAITPSKSKPLAPAEETNVAGDIPHGVSIPIEPALEFDSAGNLATYTLTPDDVAAIANAVWEKFVANGVPLQILEIWQRQGLDAGNPQTYGKDNITVGGITIDVEDTDTETKQTRQ